ncbi:MAG TPA: multicopper oxidase domain-containing protein [Candidatus Sulfotelmatobacter sp.]|nr:multicopper oxidase domain-containing protein [Candidatus Sulfotelmatobacter sp.]
MKHFFKLVAILALSPILLAQSSGKTRIYFIAADEVDWDYAPGGINKMMGMKFEGYSNTFIERGPHRIGTVYRKAIYREYKDETFAQLKPRPAEWATAGILGPILRAEVGDTIKIIFKNNATRPYSMHPHGVFYDKDSEGAPYDDGTSGADKEDDAVAPGKTHTYIWKVPERAGPGPNDPSSLVWLYHSHTNELKDVESGLVGAMIISRRGMADDNAKPKDVDREFVCLFLLFDENSSWYLDHNIQTFTGDPKGVNKLEFAPVDDVGNFSGLGSGFTIANAKFAINGYIYGTGPMMVMKKGERVRWYLVALGEQFSVHTPHWHGNVVLHDGKRTDVVPLMQAQMETVDMVPDNPGIWMFHCHIDDHMDAGMVTLYKVEP